MINQKMYDLGSCRSCIRELFEYGQMRRAEGHTVLDFSLGNPSVPAPEAVNHAIRSLLDSCPSTLLHGYTSASGGADAKSAVAADLNARFDAGIRPGDLFLGCGAAPELVSVIRALAVKDSEFVVIAPFFPEYRPFVESSGGKIRIVPADVPAFQLNLSAVEQALNEHTQALILNSPNNPSGTVYTEQTLRALAALLTEKSRQFGHPIYILSDEPYRELCYDGKTAPWIPALYPDTIVCYSWSKSLSLPGERIGYVCVPPQAGDHDALLAAVAGAARSIGHVCAPSLMQQVVARCAGVRPDLAAYDHNRRLLADSLRAFGYEMASPDGAFYLFVRAPGGDSEAFSEKARQQDLLIVPGTDFGCREYFRLCYCVTEDTIRQSLPVFKALIDNS